MAKASQIINDAQKTSTRLESFLEEAVATRRELNRQLANARKRLDTKTTSTYYPTKLAEKAIKIVKERAPEILMFEIDVAASKSEEFSNPVYKNFMFNVAKDMSIYKMITSGTGWDIQLKPQIVFEEEAGTLNDYAKGITIYRTVLRTLIGKEGTNRGLKATNWWQKNIYGTSRQDKTIEERVRLSARGAPFWQLLNNGSVGMPSDRPDGSFNPLVTPPTDFIGKAEKSIGSEFLLIMLPEKIKWAQEAQDLLRFIEQTVNNRDRVSADIKNIRFGIQENQRIFDSFGELKAFVDKDELYEAVKRFRADPASEKRILISSKGSKRRVFLTARRLEGFGDY